MTGPADETSDTTEEDSSVVAEEDEEETDDEDEEEDEDEPAEDPEIVALKEEIAKLEVAVKEKRRHVRSTSDRADDFSKAGYARRVAEMEQMRRTRTVRYNEKDDCVA